MTIVTLLTLNVNGISTPQKQSGLLEWLAVNKVNIAMTQEARLSRDAAARLQAARGDGYQIHTHYIPDQTNDRGTPRTGIATIVRGKGFAITRSDGGKQDPLGGCATYRIRCKGRVVNVANIYAPATGSQPRASFFREVTKWAKNTKQPQMDIVMGDLNMVMDPELDRSEDGARAASREEYDAWYTMLDRLGRGTRLVDVWRTVRG